MKYINKFLITPMTRCVHNMFFTSFKKEWFETYFVIDLHGTIIKKTYKQHDENVEYYPYAKELMQLLTKRKDIKLIMYTCSHPKEIEYYNSVFLKDGIIFDSFNENNDISSRNGNFGFYEKKFYFNIMMDDKAGFEPEVELEALYNLFLYYDKINFFPDEKWTTKY